MMTDLEHSIRAAIRRASDSLVNGANEIERLRRNVDVQNVQLDMGRVLHQITNPGQHNGASRVDGFGPDAVYIMRSNVAMLRELTELIWSFEPSTEPVTSQTFATVNPDTFTEGSKDVE